MNLLILSIKNFSNYRFKTKKIISLSFSNKKNLVCIPVILIIIFLSTLVTNYIFSFGDHLLNINSSENTFNVSTFINQYIFIFALSILLLFRRTMIYVRNLAYIPFLLNSFFIWNNYFITDNLLSNQNGFLNLNLSHQIKLDLINIKYLLLIEIIYFVWSYISNESKISDWNIPKPQNSDFYQVINLLVFYGIINFYYIYII